MTTRIVGRRQVKGVSRRTVAWTIERPRALRAGHFVDIHTYLCLPRCVPCCAVVRRLLEFLRATCGLVRVKVLILDSTTVLYVTSVISSAALHHDTVAIT